MGRARTWLATPRRTAGRSRTIVGRLTDPQAAALLRALGGQSVTEPTAAAPADRLGADAAEERACSRLEALARDARALDELGRALTLDLAAYLNKPVRCSVGASSTQLAHAWHFQAVADGMRCWIDVDVDLAGAFADAMIGGNGVANIGRGRRVRALAAIVVRRMFSTIARAAGVDPENIVVEQRDPGVDVAAAFNGLCAVATTQHPWSFGFARAAGDRVPARSDPDAGRRDLLERPVELPSATSEHAPVLFSSPVKRLTPLDMGSTASEAVLHAAIAALRSRLDEVTHAHIADAASVAYIEHPDAEGPAAPWALALALTAASGGAIVAFVDVEAVLGLASATVGGGLTRSGDPGEVVLAAAEAIVRDAIGAMAKRMPIAAAETQRFVRLTDEPLPARTPHHAIVLPLSGECAGRLRVLVPSWMLQAADTR